MSRESEEPLASDASGPNEVGTVGHLETRRKFIKHVGLGSVAAGFMPASLSAKASNRNPVDDDVKNISAHAFNQTYSGEYLKRIAFPVGGMGAGMFCIEGSGAVCGSRGYFGRNRTADGASGAIHARLRVG